MDIFGVTLIINEKEPSVVFLWLLVRSAKKKQIKIDINNLLIIEKINNISIYRNIHVDMFGLL